MKANYVNFIGLHLCWDCKRGYQLNQFLRVEVVKHWIGFYCEVFLATLVDTTGVEHSVNKKVISIAGIMHWVFTALCMCCYCIHSLYINSNYCIKSGSTILPVSCLEGIIYCSKILHHSSDDMGSLSINSIDRDNMYPYLSLSAGVQAWGKGQRCLSSQNNKATQYWVSERLKALEFSEISLYSCHQKLGQNKFVDRQISTMRLNLKC